MRYLVILIIYLSILSSSYAAEPSKISVLISQIKTAKASEKHLLINQLKIQLREANKETKAKTMAELRKSLNSNKTINKTNKLQYSNQNKTTQHNKLQNQKQKKQQHDPMQYKGKK